MKDEKVVRMVIEVPSEYKRAVKVLAASGDTTIKALLMEGIEQVCKKRQQEHLLNE